MVGVDYSFECVRNVQLMRAALGAVNKGWASRAIIGVRRCRARNQYPPFQLGALGGSGAAVLCGVKKGVPSAHGYVAKRSV